MDTRRLRRFTGGGLERVLNMKQWRCPMAWILCLTAASFAHGGTVQGRFLYVDQPFSFAAGFGSTNAVLPIRLARVEVLNAATGAVLASGATTGDGSVNLSVSSSGTADLRVRCYSSSVAFGQPLRVVAVSSLEYSVTSATYNGWKLSNNLQFGDVVAQAVISNANLGNPFNMLDMMVASIEYIKSLGAPNPSTTLGLTWPSGGSFASGSMANIAADDGYDDLVQLHEFGHVIHNVYSDSDNPGGSHTFGQSDQDPRLAYGEGWASFFAGAVRNFRGEFDPGYYIDCHGQGQVGPPSIQLRMRFEDGYPYTADTRGEGDEGAVFTSLWDVIDRKATNDGNGTDDDPLDGTVAFTAGVSADALLWKSFVGPAAVAVDATIRDLWNGLFSPTDPCHDDAIAAAYGGWGLSFRADAAEPDNTLAAASLLLPGAWSDTHSLYYSSAKPAAPGDGDHDFFRTPFTAGSSFEIETRYPDALIDAGTYVDPWLRLYRPDGSLFGTYDSGGIGRNAKASAVADASGYWSFEVFTNHAYRKSGSYEVRARLIAPPSVGCANLAATATHGVGKAGMGGMPKLTALTDPALSQTFSVELTGGPAHFPGWLLIGATATDIPFDLGHVYVGGAYLLPFTTDGQGRATWSNLVPASAQCGSTTHVQAMFWNDPGAAGPYHTSQSQRLTFVVGG